MLYRVLGGFSLALGALFALVAVLIFLPFLSNYNTSLLVLTLIFAIFAWIFGSIGWQLLHPPRPRAGRAAGEDAMGVETTLPSAEAPAVRATTADVEAWTTPETDTASIQPVYAKLTPTRDTGVSFVPASDDSRRPSASLGSDDDQTAWAVDEDTTVVLDAFVGFGDDGSAPRADAPADNGASGNGRSTGTARPQFRKPGAPLPPDRALG